MDETGRVTLSEAKDRRGANKVLKVPTTFVSRVKTEGSSVNVFQKIHVDGHHGVQDEAVVVCIRVRIVDNFRHRIALKENRENEKTIPKVEAVKNTKIRGNEEVI